MGLPMNLNKRLVICCLADFKVCWPQDPAVCGYATQPSSKVWTWRGERGGASVFPERAVGMILETWSWEGVHPTQRVYWSLCDAVKETMTKGNSEKNLFGLIVPDVGAIERSHPKYREEVMRTG